MVGTQATERRLWQQEKTWGKTSASNNRDADNNMDARQEETPATAEM